MAMMSRDVKIRIRLDGIWRDVDLEFIREGDEMLFLHGDHSIAMTDAYLYKERSFQELWVETIPCRPEQVSARRGQC